MQKLKELRNEMGLTQCKLAQKLGLSRSTIAMYETGQSEPDLQTLISIAVFFKVSVDFILGLEAERNVVKFSDKEDQQISNDKKQLIEMVKELSEDDVLIAKGVIARLNNKPVEDIFKKIN